MSAPSLISVPMHGVRGRRRSRLSGVRQALRRLVVCLPQPKQRQKPAFTSLPLPQEPAIRADVLPTNNAEQPSHGTDDSSELPGNASLHAEIQVLKGKIRELESMESVLRVQVQQKKDALNMLAHEVRTPLHSLSAAVEFVGDTTLDAVQKGFVDDIAACCAQLMSNMNSVLDNAEQHSTSTNQPRTDCFTVGSLLHHSQTLLRRLAERKGVELACQMPEERDIALEGDCNCLTQVILNLGSNAIKFTPSGGKVSLNASVQAMQGDDAWSVTVEVSDTGPGLSIEAQDKLFQRFVQADSTVKAKFGGSGLGLWICKTIIEDKMNGKIGIRRGRLQPKVGSTFWFEVTLRSSSRPSSASSLDSPSVAPPSLCVGQTSEWAAARSTLSVKSRPSADLCARPSNSSLKSHLCAERSEWSDGPSNLSLKSHVNAKDFLSVGSGIGIETGSNLSNTSRLSVDTQSPFANDWLLVVDDDPATRKLTAIQVRSMGFRNVMRAESGKHALQMFLDQPFSVVLTDRHMGTDADAIHGPELVSALWAHQNTHRPKQPLVIIGITGDSTVQQWEGVDAILQKPFPRAELESVLDQLLALSPEKPPARSDVDPDDLPPTPPFPLCLGRGVQKGRQEWVLA